MIQKLVHTQLMRKFSLNSWLYGNVAQKVILFQLDILSRKSRLARKVTAQSGTSCFAFFVLALKGLL
jgi:hypothetical protein